MKHVKLYNYWRSSASWRVRIALGLKGIDYEYVSINLLEEANLSDRYAAQNAMQQVPTLEWHDGGVMRLTQSLSIVRYLDEIFPEPPLEPSTPLLRARAWELAEMINSGIQPLQNLRVLKAIDAMGGNRKTWGADVIRRGLVAVEARASETAGRCLVGDAITIADLCLVPQLYNARRFSVELDPFPTLVRVDGELSRHPAFVAAHPDAQPDAVEGA